MGPRERQSLLRHPRFLTSTAHTSETRVSAITFAAEGIRRLFKNGNVYRRNNTPPPRLRSAEGLSPHPKRAALLPHLSTEPQFAVPCCPFHRNRALARTFLNA